MTLSRAVQATSGAGPPCRGMGAQCRRQGRPLFVVNDERQLSRLRQRQGLGLALVKTGRPQGPLHDPALLRTAVGFDNGTIQVWDTPLTT